MKVPRLRGLAASAVALATVALPLQAMAAPHPEREQGRCNQIQTLESRFPQLSQAYPGLQQALAECSGASAGPVSQMTTFGDLGGYSWAQNDINLLQSMGIMKGVGGGLFQPGGTLSRVQFAALLQRVFHLTVPANPIQFADVNQGYWGYNAVEAAAPYMGEFQTPGGLAFEPSLPMVRIDVAASLGKIEVAEGMAQLPTAAAAQAIWAGFADGSLVPAGLSQYAAVAVQSGVMKGYADGSFGVEDTLNRAQAAVLLARVLQGTETMPTGTATIGGTSSLQGTFQSQSGTYLVLTVNGTTDTLPIASTGATVTVNGQTGTLADLTAGEAVTVTLNSQNQVIAIAATNSSTGVTTLSGTVASANSSSLVLTVNGVNLTLAIAPGVSDTATAGETVTVSLNAQGQIVSITVTGTSTTTASGTVVSANASTIELLVNGAYDTYAMSPGGVAITVNGQAGSIANVAAGDTVTITLDNLNQVVAINVTATATSTVSGTVVSVNASTIELSVNGAYDTYTMSPSGVTFTVNGQAGSIANVAAGDTVTVTLNASNQVVAINVTNTVSSVSGTVVSVSNSTIMLTVNGVNDTFPIASGATVTVNGQGASLSNVTAGETATLTLNAQGQVTAIAIAGPVATHSVTGYIVGVSASDVAVAVYGTSGTTSSAYSIDTGAQITLNGTATAASSLPLGDAVTVGLDNSNGVASIAATTPSGQVTGELVSVSATQATLLVNGSLQTVSLGSAPVAFSGGSLVAVTSLALDQSITIDPTAMNGSALLVR